MNSIRDAFGLALALLAVAFLMNHCLGCGPTGAERVEHAIVVGMYERELDACREQGLMSGSFAVYEACAHAVDHRLCVQYGVRCVHTDAGAR